MTDPAANKTLEEQAQNMAHSLGITVWIFKGQIFANKPGDEAVEVRPPPGSKPAPYGAPAETGSAGDVT